MAERTDIHRPAEFNPADYRVVDYLDNKKPEPPYPGAPHAAYEAYEEFLAIWKKRIFEHFPNWRTGGDDHKSIFQCNHCGHPAIRYVAVVEHIPTGAKLAFGEICAERTELDGRDDFRKKYIFDKAKKMLLAYERTQERIAFEARAGAVVEFLKGINDDYDSKEPEFLISLKGQLAKKGTLSDAQIAAADKFRVTREERAARRAREDEEFAATTPLVAGKREVAGLILSTKVQHGHYGSTLKMLVREDDNNKVWGTVPQAIMRGDEDLRGKRVTFKATVERSKDDEHFGFFSRPTGARLIEEVTA